tara:strand:- start:646 stop:897 length:252 start_codon:yes stop_codon:yes gene_type:complete
MNIKTLKQWKTLSDDDKLKHKQEVNGNTLTLNLTINTDIYSNWGISLDVIANQIKDELYDKTIFVERLNKKVHVVQACTFTDK